MKRKNPLSVFTITAILGYILFVPARNVGATSDLLMMIVPILSAAANSTTIEEKIPSLALLAAKDTDKIEIAWVPGSDGKTPVNQIQYEIHLSVDENFTPGPSTLKKTVTGVSQAEVDGLAIDTVYYGRIIARYAAFSSDPSNQLETKTFKNPAQMDSSTVVATAEDLGLGKHTTTDGITYSYTGGTPPEVGSVLFSEDASGDTNIRRVDSVAIAGDGTVTVQTSDASLTDALDVGSLSTSSQLFNVAAQAENLPASNRRIAAAMNSVDADGSQHYRVQWKDDLLTAEQTNYAYHEKKFTLIPQGNSSFLKMAEANAVKESFTGTVEATFEAELIAEIKWGGSLFKIPDLTKIAAKGSLSLTALAEYNFSAAGSVEKEFKLWERSWKSRYYLIVSGIAIPVYQEIILTMDVKTSASASAEINATANAKISKSVEVGAIYDGSEWRPYIIHDRSDSLAASLDIAGKANAEIRLIPKIEVKYYSSLSSSLSVEPFVSSSLDLSKTTDNADFLTSNPERLLQLDSFDVSLGLEANVAVSLNALGSSWDILPSTCVTGTSENCLAAFEAYKLFSIPDIVLTEQGLIDSNTNRFTLVITDGDANKFDSNSIRWEVYPPYASVTPESCSRIDNVTRCSATVTWPYSEEYTVFASGHGVLNEPARQFRELKILPYSCTYSIEAGHPEGIGYRVDCLGSLPNGKFLSKMMTEYELTVESTMEIYTAQGIESYRQIRCYLLSHRQDIQCEVNMLEHIDVTGQFEFEPGWYVTKHTGQCPDDGCGVKLTLDKQDPAYGDKIATIIDSGCLSEYKKIIIDEENYECEYDQNKAAAFWARIQIHNEYLFNLVGENLANDVKKGKGSCHDWWDHYDENGVWQECGF